MTAHEEFAEAVGALTEIDGVDVTAAARMLGRLGGLAGKGRRGEASRKATAARWGRGPYRLEIGDRTGPRRLVTEYGSLKRAKEMARVVWTESVQSVAILDCRGDVVCTAARKCGRGLRWR